VDGVDNTRFKEPIDALSPLSCGMKRVKAYSFEATVTATLLIVEGLLQRVKSLERFVEVVGGVEADCHSSSRDGTASSTNAIYYWF